MVEYANQYGEIGNENIEKEVVNSVKTSEERFTSCMSAFHNFEKSMDIMNEKVKNQALISRDIEIWLRNAEETITAEPRWKVQVFDNRWILILMSFC